MRSSMCQLKSFEIIKMMVINKSYKIILIFELMLSAVNSFSNFQIVIVPLQSWPGVIPYILNHHAAMFLQHGG